MEGVMPLTPEEQIRLQEIKDRADQIDTDQKLRMFLRLGVVVTTIAVPGAAGVAAAGFGDTLAIVSAVDEIRAATTELRALQTEQAHILGQPPPQATTIAVPEIVIPVTTPEGPRTITLPPTVFTGTDDSSGRPTITVPTIVITVDDGADSGTVTLPEITIIGDPTALSVPEIQIDGSLPSLDNAVLDGSSGSIDESWFEDTALGTLNDARGRADRTNNVTDTPDMDDGDLETNARVDRSPEDVIDDARARKEPSQLAPDDKPERVDEAKEPTGEDTGPKDTSGVKKPETGAPDRTKPGSEADSSRDGRRDEGEGTHATDADRDVDRDFTDDEPRMEPWEPIHD
jgi:hypothetical protein